MGREWNARHWVPGQKAASRISGDGIGAALSGRRFWRGQSGKRLHVEHYLLGLLYVAAWVLLLTELTGF